MLIEEYMMYNIIVISGTQVLFSVFADYVQFVSLQR